MRYQTLGAAGLVLAACAMPAAGPPPVEAQLATACGAVATGYRTAAIYRAQGKLTPDSVQMLIDLEPAVRTACDPAHPPADVAGALAVTTTALQSLTLANAGVK